MVGRGSESGNVALRVWYEGCFGQSFAHLQERETEIFTAYGVVSYGCGRQGFGERQRGTTCTV